MQVVTEFGRRGGEDHERSLADKSTAEMNHHRIESMLFDEGTEAVDVLFFEITGDTDLQVHAGAFSQPALEPLVIQLGLGHSGLVRQATAYDTECEITHRDAAASSRPQPGIRAGR